ncbi:integrase/recombinase XerC/integrase/recombinase XerD, partial [Salsuginibacillus halophilus]
MTNETEIILETFVEEHLSRLQEQTLVTYKRNIIEFLDFAQIPLQDVRPSDVRKWMAHLNHYEPATIHQKIASLRLFFDYGVEEQMVEKNPIYAIELPKLKDRVPEYLTREQLMQLRMLTNRSRRERAIIEMFYATGVRLSELIAMKQTDIDWEGRHILIRKGKGKKERLVLFTPECEQQVKDYLKERADEQPYLFLNSKGRPLQSRTLRLMFEGYSKQLGFKVTPHTMRHTFAAHLAEKGMPLVHIQDLLGHDTIGV